MGKEKKHSGLKILFIVLTTILLAVILVISTGLIVGKIYYDKHVLEKSKISYNEALSLAFNLRKQNYLKEVKEIKPKDQEVVDVFDNFLKSVAIDSNCTIDKIKNVIGNFLKEDKKDLTEDLYNVLESSNVDFKKYKISENPKVDINSSQLTSIASLALKEILNKSKIQGFDLSNKIEIKFVKYINETSPKLIIDVRMSVGELFKDILKQNQIPEGLSFLTPNKIDVVMEFYMKEDKDPIISLNNFKENKKLSKILNTLIENLHNFSENINIKKIAKDFQTNIKNTLNKDIIKTTYKKDFIQINTLDTAINILLKEKTENEKQNFKKSFIYIANQENSSNKKFFSNNEQLEQLNKKLNNIFLQDAEDTKILEIFNKKNLFEEIKNNINIKKYAKNKENLNKEFNISKNEINEILFYILNNTTNENINNIKDNFKLLDVKSYFDNNVPSIELFFTLDIKNKIEKNINDQSLNQSLKNFLIKYISKLIEETSVKIKIYFNEGINFKKISGSYIDNVKITINNDEIDEYLKKVNNLMLINNIDNLSIDKNDLIEKLKTYINQVFEEILEKSNLNKIGENTFLTIDSNKGLKISSISQNLLNLLKLDGVEKEELNNFLLKFYNPEIESNIDNSLLESNYNSFINNLKNSYFLKDDSNFLESTKPYEIFSNFSNLKKHIDYSKFLTTELENEKEPEFNNLTLAYMIEKIIKENCEDNEIFKNFSSHKTIINDKTVLYTLKVEPKFENLDKILEKSIPEIYISLEFSFDQLSEIKVKINNFENKDLEIFKKIFEKDINFSEEIAKIKTKISEFLNKLDITNLKFKNNTINLANFSSIIVNEIIKSGIKNSIEFSEEEKENVKKLLRRLNIEKEDITQNEETANKLLAERIKEKADEKYLDLLEKVIVENINKIELIINEEKTKIEEFKEILPKKFKIFTENKDDEKIVKVNDLSKEETELFFKVLDALNLKFKNQDNEEKSLSEVIEYIIN